MDALKEIANALNTTPDEADRKLRNINSQYLRERRIYKRKNEEIWGWDAIPRQVVWLFTDELSA
jgi:hypothetical protein